MNVAKRITVGVVLVAIVSITGWVASPMLVHNQLAPLVTVARLKQVKRGMRVDDVERILGMPYFITSFREHSAYRTTGQRCVANGMTEIHQHASSTGFFYATINDTSEAQQLVAQAASDSARYQCDTGVYARNTTFLYSKDAPGPGSYPMVWVKFDASLRVSNVYAMNYVRHLTDSYADIVEDAVVIYSVGSTWTPDVQKDNQLNGLFGR